MGATIKYQGVSHLALVCDDMARTVEFYENVMDMPLVKSMEMPGVGQHFFFDIGNGDALAFFCYDDALVRPAAPGIAAPGTNTDVSANGSMHHIAFRIEPDEVEACCERFAKLGVDYQFKAHNKGSDGQDLSDVDDEDTFCASIYLWDPDGIRLELCAWLPSWYELGNDVAPMSRKVPVA
ncbi:VOC family protein [Amycolatopsis sp. NPDC005232]|uniref:VOC family protein n=1 Tax=unclassified Amycolatopsis TaxID=2618356 RepID=UPI001C6A7F8C|nr:VOC family protein [Amycolatopsis sp. DSM 110486]QYN19291.1 VOC family protein [Amycolatopsis sp. DSM 110486]